jgi:type VI secretion system protein ImpL
MTLTRLFLFLSLILIMAAVWILGPLVGLEGVPLRLLVILALLLLAVSCVLLVVLRRARPRPVAREKSPVREQMLAALRTLKTSHVGQTRGRAALYQLPWLLVMGHRQAGSSQAVFGSGLTFSLAAQGSGGPQHCRWGFATEGILLDVPGRYLSDPEDAPEWQEFLRLLKTHRPGGPLEGILLTVALPELQTGEAEARARQLRSRISEVEGRLGARLPVYLLFTKLDLLPGFAAFFEDLAGEERRQAWGAALSHDQGPGFDPVAAVDRHFAQLHQGLAELGTGRLARNRANLDRPALTTFPVAFRQLGPAVRGFVEHLVGNDPYHARPFIRGFYFASALQTAGPEPAPSRLADCELAPASLARAVAGGSRPYFLEQLFRQVIFPDRFLASHLRAPRRDRVQLGWMSAGLAGLALLGAAWVGSFLGNRRLVAQARTELATARQLAASEQLGARMRALELLQPRLEQLCRNRREGRPRTLGWGLYQGPALEPILRGQYFAGVSELMLTPVQCALESVLARAGTPPQPRPRRKRPVRPRAGGSSIIQVAYQLPARPAPAPPAAEPNPEQLYSTLKTYLMLHQRERMEAAHLADQLLRFWRPFLASHGDPGLSRQAESVVAFYLTQLDEPDLPVIGNRPELVAAARRQLRARTRLLSPLEQHYSLLKSRADAEFEPMTVARILRDQDLDLVAGSRAVPGSFTREACEKFFQAAIREAGNGLHGADWVLASPQTQDPPAEGPEREQIRTQLEALYKADYRQAWDAFLQGLGILGFGDPLGAAAALGRLGDPAHSPLKLILARVALETAWDNPGELEKSLRGLKDGALARAGKVFGPRAPAAPSSPHGTLGTQFSGLALLTSAGEGGGAPIDGYLQLLQKARTRLEAIALAGDPAASSREYLQGTILGSTELAEAQHCLDATLLSRVDGHGRDLLRPILLRPLVQAFSALVPAAEQDLNRAWSQQVLGPWSALAGKYPFADAGNEAPMADIQAFLKPAEGTLPKFVDKVLGPLVALQGDQLIPRHWAGRGVGFSETFLRAVSRLGQAATVLQDAAPSRFELQPVPAPGMREIILEIDGQKLHYRNGPQSWTAFSWPGQASFQGARLQVVAVSGATAQLQNLPGRLGLLRLLDRARTDAADGSSQTLEWPVAAVLPAGSQAAPEHARIRFNFRMVSGPDPLRLSALRHHALPARATP